MAFGVAACCHGEGGTGAGGPGGAGIGAVFPGGAGFKSADADGAVVGDAVRCGGAGVSEI
ncbi:MAG: hypothetical protein EBY70_08215 [Burkholderiaceae bacterium]|nr:hypothetical protein [Burkholderiaceae bacterium]